MIEKMTWKRPVSTSVLTLTTGNILSTASQGHKKLMAMTYFQNIHSLADLKKEYRRLALEHHPDKGGDTAIMQQVTTELEGFLRLGKKNRIFPRPQPDMNMTIREPRQRNTPVCV